MFCVTRYVAMLRAVNVSGTGKLPMAELKAMGEACGFTNVRTFIASGNLLFDSDEEEAKVARSVAGRVEAYFGKPVPVFVRSAAEITQVAAGNPFADEPGNRVVAHFMAAAPTQAMLDAATGQKDERMALGTRQIYIFYGDGMGNSKLKLPALRDGTARNMNSVKKMAELLA
jgi:uncharacterized protein (DUF1697 family)